MLHTKIKIPPIPKKKNNNNNNVHLILFKLFSVHISKLNIMLHPYYWYFFYSYGKTYTKKLFAKLFNNLL